VPVHKAQVRMDRPTWEALERAVQREGKAASEVLRECAERFIRKIERA